jgi:glycosyltransferase involved in cell wall biosynthesis
MPPVREESEPPFDGAYLCAIGGEGRDFRCLMEAAAGSGVNVAVIARPHNLLGLAIPSNVRTFTNIPLDKTWAIAKGSSGVVVPLLSNDTCCGQITIVSAQMLGLPVITNFSHALKEYLSGEGVALLFDPGDASELAEKMLSLLKNRIEFLDISNRASGYYMEKYRRSLWAAFLKETIEGRAN